MTLPTYGREIVRSPDLVAAGSSGWELLQDIIVPVNTTQVDITVDGDTDLMYMIIAEIKTASAGNRKFEMRMNNDSGVGTYDHTGNTDTGNTATPGDNELDVVTISGILTSDISIAQILIAAASGFKRTANIFVSRAAGAEDRIGSDIQNGAWLNTVDNLTQINFIASVANELAAGSRFRVFRPSTL